MFPRQIIQHQGNRSLAPNTDAEEAEVDLFFEELQYLPELIPKKKDVLFIIGDWNAKIGSQEIPK